MKLGTRVFVRGFVLIVLLVAGGWLVKASGIATFLDEAWIDAHVRGEGFAGDAVFLIAASLLVAGGFPRQVVSFLAGYAFGLGLGFVHGLVASGIGCALAFLATRYLARTWVAAHLPQRFRHIDAFLSRNTFSATVAIRFMPLGNNLAVNLAAGLSQANGWTFVTASVVGYVPQTFVFALLGSGLSVDPALRLSVGIALFVVATVLSIYLLRKYRRSREVEEILAQ